MDDRELYQHLEEIKSKIDNLLSIFEEDENGEEPKIKFKDEE